MCATLPRLEPPPAVSVQILQSLQLECAGDAARELGRELFRELGRELGREEVRQCGDLGEGRGERGGDWTGDRDLATDPGRSVHGVLISRP